MRYHESKRREKCYLRIEPFRARSVTECTITRRVFRTEPKLLMHTLVNGRWANYLYEAQITIKDHFVARQCQNL